MKIGMVCLVMFAAATVSAQFDKYKVDRNQKNSVSPPPPKSRTKNLDNFGRKKEVEADTGQYRKDDKFVNLNPETAFGPEVIKNFNHSDTTLMELTRFMQKLTGINFILDEQLKEKISIMAPGPITVGDAWKAYLTVLNMNGYTLVKSGAFYKIVSNRKKRDKLGGKIYTGRYTPSTANVVMRVIALKYIDAKEFASKFRRIMPSGGEIIDLGKTNTVLIRDTGENINRIVRLIEFIDVPGHDETLQIVKVEHSSAQEIAGLLDQILSDQKSGRGRFRSRSSRNNQRTKGEIISRIIADPRTNTIIAMANAEGARRLRSLIKKLDTKNVAAGGGQIHVYYLNHGNAETLSATLEKLVSSSARSKRKPSRSSRSRSTFSGNIPEISLFNNAVKITADKDNNALVITASPTDYLTIKEVIKKLDIPRDQVYVEGMIMETMITKDKELGTSIQGAYGKGAVERFGFGSKKGEDAFKSLVTNPITILGGMFGFQSGTKINFGGKDFGSINALISAIIENTNSNVLATPQILALDNTEAIFEVGESIPVPKQTIGNSGVSTTSYTPQTAKLKLKITPQINKVTRFVKLEIEQEIADFTDRYKGEGGSSTAERGAKTTVVVRDRDTIAMGGLMRDKETAVKSKVPLLGDIPILGWLFRSKRESVQKVNLLMFMTPRILANYQKDSARNTRDLLDRRATHLKDVIRNDAFEGTAKELYDKSKRQEEGPLYNLKEGEKYLRENEKPGIGNPEEASVPDYGKIIQKVRQAKAATKESP